MGLLVGIQMLIALRVLGIGERMPVVAMRPYLRVAWLGLVINVISGTLPFLINYDQFLHNAAFIAKLVMLVLLAPGTWLLTRSIFAAVDSKDIRPRLLAGVCLLLWLGAIVAGRLVAYTDAGGAL